MGSSRHLEKAIKEEGRECFVKTIFQEFPTRELALEHEVFLHNKFDVGKNPLFYNKVKQTSTKFDASTLTGPKNHMYGKHQSEEVKEKIRKKRAKKILPPTTQESMCKAKSGENNPRYGKPVTQETRNKHSIHSSNRPKYIYITPIGEFKGTREAGKALGCSINTVLRRCKKEFEGYSIKKVEDKKEEFKMLYEQGLRVTEISKILGVPTGTLHAWKDKFGLSRERPWLFR